jgi:hypothetical protein
MPTYFVEMPREVLQDFVCVGNASDRRSIYAKSKKLTMFHKCRERIHASTLSCGVSCSFLTPLLVSVGFFARPGRAGRVIFC